MNQNQGKRAPLTIDRDRVTCLLLINTQLMKRAINIYSNILVNQAAIARLLQQDKQRVLDQYQNYTRRLHCNLQVLTFIHEKYHLEDLAQKTSKTPFPIIVQAPSDMPELNNLYNKLQELYPEAVQFIRMKIQQMKEQQGGGNRGSPAAMANQGVGMVNQGPGINQRSSLSNSPMVNNIPINQLASPPKQMPQQMPQQIPQQVPQQQMSQLMPQLMPPLMISQQMPQQLPQQMASQQMSQNFQQPLSLSGPLGSPQNGPTNQFSDQMKPNSMNNVNFIQQPQMSQQPPQSQQPQATQPPLAQQSQQPAQSISPQQLYQQINPSSPGNMMDFFN